MFTELQRVAGPEEGTLQEIGIKRVACPKERTS